MSCLYSSEAKTQQIPKLNNFTSPSVVVTAAVYTECCARRNTAYDEILLFLLLWCSAVRGFKHGAPLDQVLQQLDAQQRVLYYPDAPTLFHALQLGRVQAIFSQPPIYRYFLAKELDSGSFVLLDWAPELGSTAHHLVLQRNTFSVSQAQAWQQLLEQLQAEGELSRIFQRYLPPDEAQLLELSIKP